MSRDDLHALTADALAALSNRGLVKRAQKEIEAGQVPALEELADGTVVGRFSNVETRLPRGVSLSDAPCSCGAAGICRHKLIVALVYAASAPPPATAEVVQAWSPGSITDDELERFLGKRAFERALSLLRRGYVAEVRRVWGDDRVPTVLLPTSSVRFLVPGDLNYAHSDGGERAAEAVALAVWAFRAADAKDPAATRLELEVSDAAAPSASFSDKLSPALALAEELLLEGIVHSRDSMAGQFERVREALNEARLTWPALILEDIEQELLSYHARSARYSPSGAAALLCELFARERAVRRPGALPAARVLGTEDALQTPLSHLRLASLGARVKGDATYRLAEVALADPDTATVLVMRKEYPLESGKAAPRPSALRRKLFAPRATLGAIATGQVVTESARRAANRLLILGRSRVAQTSVVPSSGDFGSLPEGLRVRDTSQLEQALATRPPSLLRARLLADAVHVLEIAEVQGVRYAPGDQRLSAILRPHEGPSVRLVRTYDAATAGALGDLADALSGKTGAPRFVSGSVRRTALGLEIEPLGIVTDRFHVPDLADPSDHTPLGAEPEPDDDTSALTHALEQASGALDDAAHHGLRRASRSYVERLNRQAEAMRRLGLTELAARFEALRSALGQSQASGDAGSEAALVARWADAAIRVRLCQESAG
ncbi:MAG: hypothetical protein JW940_28495 [Polyangiaceae bacterium]|nr:hypothetical protein [Polyangiaceae bacterium]